MFTRNYLHLFLGLLSIMATFQSLHAAPPAASDFTALPLAASTAKGIPLVMLAMSKDHQLFYKAYTDYNDLDGDNKADSTYKTAIVYDGYFDPQSCYQYVVNQFERVRAADASHYCNSASEAAADRAFSGNFLNWATMTRMDLIRHVLYGGLRSTDTATTTVLERAHLPNDAHSFAKYYNGSDLTKLVPYQIAASEATATRLNLLKQNEADKKSGITFCNTTLTDPANLNRLSQNETNPPIVRIVRGNFSFWAASERYQCLGWAEDNGHPSRPPEKNNEIIWFASDTTPGNAMPQATAAATFNDLFYGGSPSLVNMLVDFGVFAEAQRRTIDGRNAMEDLIVRVKVCAAGELSERCKEYGMNRKSEGILQEFGKTNKMYFGLMTGSFIKNKSGASLRKHIASIKNEIAADGTFKSGSDVADGSIIKFIDSLRIMNWSHGLITGSFDNPDGVMNSYLGRATDNCGAQKWDTTGKLNTFADGRCISWGNPFGNILAASYRYFGGDTANNLSDADMQAESAFFADATLKALNKPKTWAKNPLRDFTTGDTDAEVRAATGIAQSCPSMSVLGFNASTYSYDNLDAVNLPVATNASGQVLEQAIPVKGFTNTIGKLESLETGSYFVGEAPNATDNGQCTVKAISRFGEIKGTCPEAPRLQGSFNMAGLAYYARTHDMNKRLRFPELGNTIRTLGVDLAPGLPSIKVQGSSPQKSASIVPVCRNSSVGGNCAIVDFKILEQTATSGKFAVVWEDTEQGTDYDQDLLGTISYSLSGDTLSITTRIVQKSTDDSVGFGYVISGVSNPGLVFSSKINNFACGACAVMGVDKQNSFTLSANNLAGRDLQSPLYYAARWGGYSAQVDFTKIQGYIPEATAGYEPIPVGPAANDSSGYIKVDKPQDLKVAVKTQIDSANRPRNLLSGGTSVARSADGVGLAVQSYYFSEYQSGNNTVNWLGGVNGFFTDEEGRLREDSGTPNGKLDASDVVINIKSADGVTHFDRISAVNGDVIESNLDISLLKPLWSARDQLANVTSASAKIQRDFQTASTSHRYILTGKHSSSGVNSTIKETIPFTASGTGATFIDTNYQKLLEYSAPVDLINYIRGEESDPFRSRTIAFKSGDSPKPWLLGDVVNSQPLIVKGAVENFDFTLGDKTYAAFRSDMQKRRHVVYVGANDGLLHAFNAGFYDTSLGQYSKTSETKTAHELGAELWAYAPYNLLPHLKWLADKHYSHNFYVDGKLQQFDVKIFTPSSQHPGGWGTILVGAMRLGGGAYNLDFDADGTPDQTARSAVMIFDISDPEAAPKLLAEITDPDLGFTTSNFAISRQDDTKWTLHFGSGPLKTDFTSLSTRDAYLYSVDLSASAMSLTAKALGQPGSFVGNITAQDWNLNGKTDALYFGTVRRDGTDNRGALNRVTWNADGSLSATLLISSTDQEFLGEPFAVSTSTGEAWIFMGSGSYLTLDDNSRAQSNTFYGVLEPLNSDGSLKKTSIDIAQLQEVKDVKAFTNGKVLNGASYVDRKVFANTVKSKGGWKLTLPADQRDFNRTEVYGLQYLLFDTFKPAAGCGSSGESFLYLRDFATGLVPSEMLNQDNFVYNAENLKEVKDGKSIASAVVTSKEIIQDTVNISDDQAGGTTEPLFDLGGKSARNSWREVIGQ